MTVRVSKSKINQCRAELKRLHKIYSWRKLATDKYKNEVKFQVLARFATDKNYIPADEKILLALDIVHVPPPPSPYRLLPRWYKRTPEALAYFNGTRAKIKEMFNNARTEIRKERQ